MTDLKIEAGKCYRTREGKKAHVLAIRSDAGCGPYAALGYIDGYSDADSWTLAGHNYGPVSPSNHDLISEWKEPRKGEVWVNVYDRGLPLLFKTREAADAASRYDTRISLLGPIPWTEGQGLDGEGGK